MNRYLTIAVLGLAISVGGCTSIVDEDNTEQFFADLGNTSITVYPTYIKRMARDDTGKPLGRDASNSGYEHNETERLVAFLRCECVGDVKVSTDEVPLDGQWQRTQFGIIKASTKAFGDYVAASPIETEYAMMAEYAIPLKRIWVVHAYVVNARGQPVWVLNLNDHFDVFTDINPGVPAEGTDVLLAFLRHGWPDTAAGCRTPGLPAAKSPPGILYDFESELPSGSDEHGIPLGFCTFSDGTSPVGISRTADHPPRPGQAAGNHVLEVTLDVNKNGWAGVVNNFENETVDAWVPRDWSDLESFSFWFYGNGSGAPLYVDLLDNRKGCSTYDDAARFTDQFRDDYHGWKRLTFRFADMNYRDIGNRAPNDGLGLTNVHGWGFGVTETKGPMTFYIDDFKLHSASPD